MSRQRSRTGIHFVASCAALVLGLAACSADDSGAADDSNGQDDGPILGEDGGAGDGNRIVAAFPHEPNTLDTARASVEGINLAENIFDNLVGRGRDGGIVPELAHSWEESDDGLSWTFFLEEGVEFHNGEPVNAEAVKYSIERFTDPDFGPTSFASYWASLDEIEIVDEYTITFHLNSPRPVLAQTIPWHTVVVPPGYVEEVGNEGLGQEPIGSGPFEFVEWNRGENLILEANEDYFRGAPEVDELEIRFIADESARAAAVISGEVDVAGPISLEQIPEVENADGVDVATADLSILRDRLMLRNDVPPFDDIRMRQAVNYAIDKQTIVDTILLGFGEVTAGPTVPGEFGYTDRIDDLDYPYDPERARELIEEAGYGDGVSIDFDARVGTFPKDDETPEVIAQYLEEVGISVNIINQDQGTFVEKVQTGDLGEMALGLMVGGGNFHAFHTFQIFFHCTESSGIWHPKGDDGMGIYNCYPEMDELADEAMLLMNEDEEAALDLYYQANEYAVDNAVAVFLWSYRNPYAVSDRVNWEPTVQGDFLFYEASVN